MARIVIPQNTLIGRSLLQLTAELNHAQQSASRVLRIMNEISNSGAQAVALETSPESQLPIGTGAPLYAVAVEIRTRLDALVLSLAAIDQG